MTDITRETTATSGKVQPLSRASGTLKDDVEGMSYLETLPRRIVTTYLPLSLIVFVLLFPF